MLKLFFFLGGLSVSKSVGLLVFKWFSDDYDEIGEEFDENQSMLNIDNNNNNSNDSQQENTNIIIGAQVLDVQLGL